MKIRRPPQIKEKMYETSMFISVKDNEEKEIESMWNMYKTDCVNPKPDFTAKIVVPMRFAIKSAYMIKPPTIPLSESVVESF